MGIDFNNQKEMITQDVAIITQAEYLEKERVSIDKNEYYNSSEEKSRKTKDES